MNVMKSFSDLSWTARIFKGRAERAADKVKHANHQAKRLKGRGGRSDKSQMEPITQPAQQPAPESVPQPASESVPQPAPESVPQPMVRSLSEPIPVSVPDEGEKSGALLPVVAGVLGAIAAALLSLVVADTADDRLLLVLIGVPLGAILTVGVVFAYRSAGLIDR